MKGFPSETPKKWEGRETSFTNNADQERLKSGIVAHKKVSIHSFLWSYLLLIQYIFISAEPDSKEFWQLSKCLFTYLTQ